MTKNIFSIDLEEWHTSKDIFGTVSLGNAELQVEDAVKPLLKLLDDSHVRATFFVLGETAAANPELIEEICDKGHEIGSHGYHHVSVSKAGKEAFRKDIAQSVRILKKLTGKKPIGYRAPMFSLNESTSWAFDILENEGFRYDSSLFPFKSKYYGMEGIPIAPFHLKEYFESAGKLAEYPIPVIKKLGIPFVISGGFYLRLYPLWFIKNAIRQLNRNGVPSVLYVHPWETYSLTPRVPMKQPYKFYTYYNIGGALGKIGHLLQAFGFHSFEDDLKQHSF